MVFRGNPPEPSRAEPSRAEPSRAELVRRVVVHGPGNVPGDETDPEDSTGEILLDLETVGSVAPGAKIVVYFTEFTEQRRVDALHAIVHDAVNKPSVISISYGNPETSSDAASADQRGSLWTFSAIEQASMAFQDAALKNITICVASGDGGSSDGVGDGLAHVDFPSSSPYVLGCGGTHLVVSRGVLKGESVWNNGRQGGADRAVRVAEDRSRQRRGGSRADRRGLASRRARTQLIAPSGEWPGGVEPGDVSETRISI